MLRSQINRIQQTVIFLGISVFLTGCGGLFDRMSPADEALLQPRKPLDVPSNFQELPNTEQPIGVASANLSNKVSGADIYAQNNISRIGPDGKPKSREQLQSELKTILMQKTRQARPISGPAYSGGG